MAVLAIPLVEGAALALLRALGVAAVAGAGAVAVNETAKRKAEAAEKARTTAIAKAGTLAKTKASCSKCPPDCGGIVERNWSMSDESRSYQARISGFAPYTEWNFKGTDFDGFRSSLCMLLEAKARYDQFFKANGDPKFFFVYTGRAKIMVQATSQSAVVETSVPASLHWHFMQPLSYRYFKENFMGSFFPIVTHLTP